MRTVNDLRVKIFADGADLPGIAKLHANPLIKGFTTNPTLMRKSGVTDYAAFAREVLKVVPDRPVSFEVFADEFGEMELQAREIASWGSNVNVKIPVTTTKGVFCGPVIERLSQAGIAVNVTALMTLEQVTQVTQCLAARTPAIISVFAGRVADTGRDPVPMMAKAVEIMKAKPKAELIWASPRELLNIFQADDVGCHIITVTHDVLGKLSLVGKDLVGYSLETVEMFHRDAQAAGFTIASQPARAAG
jgi:transaldolase